MDHQHSASGRPHPPLCGDLPPQGGGGWRGAGVSTTLPLRGRVGAKLRGGVIRRRLFNTVGRVKRWRTIRSAWGPDIWVHFKEYLALTDRRENSIEDRIEFCQDLGVPEADHFVSLRFQKGGSFLVSFKPFIRRMLGAVQLNDQADLMTSEIGKVGTDQDLSAAVAAIDWNAPEMAPEFSLRIRAG